MTQTSGSKGSGMSCAGWVAVAVFVLGCVGGAWWLMVRGGGGGGGNGTTQTAGGGNGGGAGGGGGSVVEITIAYGSEKKPWLTGAVEKFAHDPAGQGIKVNLVSMGSLEGADEIQKEGLNKSTQRIHVWAPASRLYKDTFVTEWKDRFQTEPIENETGSRKAESLAISPMVFVMWEDRYAVFKKKYGELNFTNLARAAQVSWKEIGGDANWAGGIKFGHTHPKESNSGLMSLILMAYEFSGKTSGLTVADTNDDRFLEPFKRIENRLSRPSGILSNSTGNMMDDMIAFGPSYYDVVLVYENVAVNRIKSAQGRNGAVRLIYPATNVWVEHPYYILNVPWSTPAHRDAAKKFLAFLLSPPIQKDAVSLGLRPANLEVSMRDPDSPFVTLAGSGISEPSTLAEPPTQEVILGLQDQWERLQVK